jgi:hypothetical protein
MFSVSHERNSPDFRLPCNHQLPSLLGFTAEPPVETSIPVTRMLFRFILSWDARFMTYDRREVSAYRVQSFSPDMKNFSCILLQPSLPQLSTSIVNFTIVTALDPHYRAL